MSNLPQVNELPQDFANIARWAFSRGVMVTRVGDHVIAYSHPEPGEGRPLLIVESPSTGNRWFHVPGDDVAHVAQLVAAALILVATPDERAHAATPVPRSCIRLAHELVQEAVEQAGLPRRDFPTLRALLPTW